MSSGEPGNEATDHSLSSSLAVAGHLKSALQEKIWTFYHQFQRQRNHSGLEDVKLFLEEGQVSSASSLIEEWQAAILQVCVKLYT